MQIQSPKDFPEDLAHRIRDGLKSGLSDEQIVKGMVSLGNMAEKFVSPDSPPEALIKQVWDEATDREKEMIAGIVLRIGKRKVH